MLDLSNYSCDKCAREFSRHCKHCYHTADKAPTRFKKKKKTGVQTPEFRNKVPMPPVKPAKENISNLRIKTVESIKIEVGKDGINDTAYIEIAGLTTTRPQINTKSSSIDNCNLAGEKFDTISVSWRDAFIPGAKIYLTGIFEDWISGELIYGEYDILNFTFTRKENHQCKE